MRAQRWKWLMGAAAVCALAALVSAIDIRMRVSTATTDAAPAAASAKSGAEPPTSAAVALEKRHELKIVAFGGSSAQGYDDPKLYGYLPRALDQVSSALHISIQFINKAKSGETAPMAMPTYDPTLHQLKPDVVILSWGILNEVSKKTPESMWQQVIRKEVSLALKEGADVWVVTPPATPATYVGHDVEPEQQFAQLEASAALSVNSNRVHVFDLMDDMKAYFASHHLSYKPYESNNWHMNHAGHVLAGHILGNDILAQAQALGLTS
ncbi:MAG: SGNH/GDSL hydrolase family protein [Alicyclobacillus sp.]|nr:SGNH/GDSL hydrolase family protein [Alicyclobacillus sp.]